MRRLHNHVAVVLAPLVVALAPACAEPSSPVATTEEAARPPMADAAKDVSPRESAECQTSSLPQTGLRRAHVEIDGDTGPIRFAVEVAETNRQRTIGMMCRKSMGDDEGMLFVFERDEQRSFWMKNTLLPLDMLFIDADGRIVGVVERAEPLTLKSRSVDGPSTYVLELLGGTASRRGLRAGQRVRFEGVHQAVPPK
jgi:uncharacterized membrane protein (UPF0127 family)